MLPRLLSPPFFVFEALPGSCYARPCVLSLSPPSQARCLYLQISFIEFTKVVIRYPSEALQAGYRAGSVERGEASLRGPRGNCGRTRALPVTPAPGALRRVRLEVAVRTRWL